MSENGTSQEPERIAYSFSNRKIRRVPLNWRHPKGDNGHFLPLFGPGEGRYEPEEIEEMIEMGDIESAEDMKSWYMPDFSNVDELDMGICVYETTSEGTPLTAVYPNTPEGMLALLCDVAENGTTFGDSTASIEAWAAILFGKADTITRTNIVSGEVSVEPFPSPTE